MIKTNFKPGLITISAAITAGLVYAIYEHKKAAGAPPVINYALLAASACVGYGAGALIAAYD